MIKTLYKQIGKYKRASLLTPVLTACEVVLDVMIPYVTASLIDKGISAGNIQNVYLYGAIMLGMAFLSLMLGILSARFASYASTGFASNVRSAMYRSIQQFSFSDIDKYSTAGLVTRMTTDVSNLQNAFQQILRITVRAPFRLVLSIIMCLVIDARLSVIFIIALIILSFSLGYIISHVSRLFTQVYKQYDQLNQSVQENISAIRVVKAFVREDHENKKFAHAAEGLYKLFTRAETLMAFNHPIMNMVVYGCIIALSWFGAHYIVSETLTTGELTSLFTYVMAILQSLMMLSMIFVMLTQSAASGQRVAEIINEEPDIQNPTHPITHVPDGSIELDHVWFAYGSSEKQEREKANEPQDQRLTALLSTLQSAPDYALKDITLSIRPGETIGVIGGTGSGKSSMVTLISRLYDVSRGTLKVGGNDVRQYDLTTLRNDVSVVLQQNVLFSGTILDNLRWGNPDATLEQCQQACRWAQADEFIDQMPDGYNTHIEQGGTNVSGGQKQRLCIARALLKSPKILVLDDSTSACDTATDAKIRHAFSTELQGMTKLIIAQRIASVKDCDRILVLDNGRMTGFDTHANLLRNNRLYQEIYKIQTEDGGDFDAPQTN
ncbi:MAG: ABC transporter ATP-binding protein [Prevotella sp.]|nr:ABC transporter ATP-binding protein [Prevotella sp.]